MNKTTLSKKAHALFRAMLEAADEQEEEEVLRLLGDARSLGLEFSIECKDRVKWERDFEQKSAILKRRSTLRLGMTKVASWTTEYVGSYGGGGAGWFIEEYPDDGLEEGIEELLEVCNVDVPPAVVPEPIYFT